MMLRAVAAPARPATPATSEVDTTLTPKQLGFTMPGKLVGGMLVGGLPLPAGLKDTQQLNKPCSGFCSSCMCAAGVMHAATHACGWAATSWFTAVTTVEC